MSNEEIVKQIQQGINPGDNMEQLYQQNHGYIYNIARRYAYKDDIEDLLQEAYFGLYEAVQRYEDTAGVLFMSYAGFWIKQSIVRYIENNGRTIRLPVNLQGRIGKYKKCITAYVTQLGRSPSDYELCRFLRVSEDTLQEIKKALCQYDNMQSLDEPLPGMEGNDILLGEGVPDRSVDIENGVVNRLIEQQLHTELWHIVKDNVSPEENTVIIARFGKSMSLGATGQSMGKSLERARQLEASALRKLRRARIRRMLEEKYEVNYARAYRGSLSNFNNSWSSIVEDIAIKNFTYSNN